MFRWLKREKKKESVGHSKWVVGNILVSPDGVVEGYAYEDIQKHDNFYSEAASLARIRCREGKFLATRDIPSHLRDLPSFEFWVYEKHRIKFKTRQALINAFNKERGL